jgi:hypothetical protein
MVGMCPCAHKVVFEICRDQSFFLELDQSVIGTCKLTATWDGNEEPFWISTAEIDAATGPYPRKTIIRDNYMCY